MSAPFEPSHVDACLAAFTAWFCGRDPKATHASATSSWRVLMPVTGKRFCQSPAAEQLRQADIDVDAIVAAQVTKPVTPTASPAPVKKEDPAPARVQPSTPAPVPPAPIATADPLTAMIAERLQAIGFAPQYAVSADTARTIAEDTALEVVSLALEELERQGKLGGSCKGHSPQFSVQVRELAKRTVPGSAPQWFAEALEYAECRQNILLIGPAGAGKSYGARLLAESLELPFYALSLTAGVDEGVLQGWLLPVGDSGRFTYVPSMFVNAYADGGVVLLDEIDSADPNMLLVMNAALDSNGFWGIPLRHDAPMLERHPDFVVVAAANTKGHGADRQYVGRQQLDKATLSRFEDGAIVVDYDSELERAQYPAEVVEYGHMLRSRCRAVPGFFPHDVSTRNLERWSNKLQINGMTVEKAAYAYFSTWNDDDMNRVHASRNVCQRTVTLD